MAMHGEPALPPDFTAFRYVNPDAPKGGRLTQGILGSFDSLNPFNGKGLPVPELQIRDEQTFIGAMQRAVKPAPATYDEVIRVNLGLATVDAEKATEWELGKNQCAAGATHASP